MRRVVLILFLVVGCLSAWSTAASIYSFDLAGVYTVAAGGTVSIPVYLELSGAELAATQTDQGLFQAGVRLTEDIGATTATSPAYIASIGDILPNNTDFDSTFALSTYTSSSDVALSEQPTGIPGPITTSGQPTGRILIGNFVFTAGALAGETTVFNAQDPDPMNDDTITWGGTVLDPTGVGSVQIITTAPISPIGVPVPAASWAGLILLAMLGLGRFRRWRRL